VQNIEKPYCWLCQKVFSNILIYNAITQHVETVGKPVEYFNMLILVSKETAEDKATDEVEPNALKASFEISYKIAKTGKNHTIGETLDHA
jgi:hypothetical protein